LYKHFEISGIQTTKFIIKSQFAYFIKFKPKKKKSERYLFNRFNVRISAAQRHFSIFSTTLQQFYLIFDKTLAISHPNNKFAEN